MQRVASSLNGLLVFNDQQGYALKILNASLEPNFVFNSQRSAELIPEYTPKLLGAATVADFSCVFSTLLDKGSLQQFEDWPTMLRAVTPVVEKLYARGGVVESLSSQATVTDLRKKMQASLNGQQFLREDFQETIDLASACLAKYQEETIVLPTLFCHGDLTPNNVVHNGHGQIFILDWANGGIQTAFYDLMIQAVYVSNARVWQEFAAINFLENDEPDVFHGWSKAFCGIIADLTHAHLTNDVVKLSLLVALAEMALKNFLRHQTEENKAEGARVITMINAVLRKIVG